MVQLMSLHPKTLSSLASFKSRPVLPFWYQLTQVVLEKRLLAVVMLALHYNSSSFLWNLYYHPFIEQAQKSRDAMLILSIEVKDICSIFLGKLELLNYPLIFSSSCSKVVHSP